MCSQRFMAVIQIILLTFKARCSFTAFAVDLLAFSVFVGFLFLLFYKYGLQDLLSQSVTGIKH